MRVYIVEDNDSMRIILKRLLKKKFPMIHEIGESDTAEQALEEISTFRPHLVLVDISLPGMDGIEMIRRLKSAYKGMCILVVTAHEVDIYKRIAEGAGAHGVVSKSNDDELFEIIGILLKKHENGGCK